jgi:hypothetical protein
MIVLQWRHENVSKRTLFVRLAAQHYNPAERAMPNGRSQRIGHWVAFSCRGSCDGGAGAVAVRCPAQKASPSQCSVQSPVGFAERIVEIAHARNPARLEQFRQSRSMVFDLDQCSFLFLSNSLKATLGRAS